MNPVVVCDLCSKAMPNNTIKRHRNTHFETKSQRYRRRHLQEERARDRAQYWSDPETHRTRARVREANRRPFDPRVRIAGLRLRVSDFPEELRPAAVLLVNLRRAVRGMGLDVARQRRYWHIRSMTPEYRAKRAAYQRSPEYRAKERARRSALTRPRKAVFAGQPIYIPSLPSEWQTVAYAIVDARRAIKERSPNRG